MAMIEIDGAYGEGGGQLLRMAVACAAIRGQPIRITRIRAGRPRPGLAAQHLAAVQGVAALCQAEVEGLSLGSQALTFRPGALKSGHFAFAIPTAGSVALVLQACLPAALCAPGPVSLRIGGGTDVRWAPPGDYLRFVLLPLLARLGASVRLEIIRRGYYPRGGGEVIAHIEPTTEWRAFECTSCGSIRALRGVAHVANLPPTIAARMAEAAGSHLGDWGPVRVLAEHYGGDQASGQGGAIVLWAEGEHSILGASCLAERGKRAEDVAREAASQLAAELAAGAALDSHAADQLLIYLALARRESCFTVREVTKHLSTLAWLLPQLLPVELAITEYDSLWRVEVRPTLPSG